MLLNVHANWGSASAPTAEHQRRRPRTASDRAGKHNRQFIGWATTGAPRAPSRASGLRGAIPSSMAAVGVAGASRRLLERFAHGVAIGA
jgi:hypothetical protein